MRFYGKFKTKIKKKIQMMTWIDLEILMARPVLLCGVQVNECIYIGEHKNPFSALEV